MSAFSKFFSQIDEGDNFRFKLSSTPQFIFDEEIKLWLNEEDMISRIEDFRDGVNSLVGSEILGPILQSIVDRVNEKIDTLISRLSENEKFMNAEIIFKKEDVSANIKFKSIKSDVLKNKGIKRPYHHVWVDGEEDKKGIIVLPGSKYKKVYLMKGSSDDPEIIYLKCKGLNYIRDNEPYYEIIDGKTYIHMNGFSGAGTEADPWQVSTYDDLKAVGRWSGHPNYRTGWEKDSYYLQTANIQCPTGVSRETFRPIGHPVLEDGTPDATKVFSGSYDGGNHIIYDLYIDGTDTPLDGGIGFFSSLTGTVQNTVLERPTMSSIAGYVGTFVTSATNATIYNCHVRDITISALRLAGFAMGVTGTTIERCSVTGGTITGNDTRQLIGGFVSVTTTATIRECFAKDLTLVALQTSSDARSAGFVANMEGAGTGGTALIEDCYADNVNLSSGFTGITRYTGGFLGLNFALTGTKIIRRCYSTGLVPGNVSYYNYGFRGGNRTLNTSEYNYYDTNTSTKSDTTQSTPKTTVQMKDVSTFVGWDISSMADFDTESPTTWFINDAIDYPRLWWEYRGYVAKIYSDGSVKTNEFIEDPKRSESPWFNTFISGAHSNAYLTTSSPVGNTLSTNFTLEWWAYRVSAHRWNAGVLELNSIGGCFQNIGGTTSYVGLASGYIYTSFNLTGSLVTRNPSYPYSITGAWHHFAITYDGSYFRIYLDGVEFYNTAVSGYLRTGGSSLQMGYFTTYWLEGHMSDVRLWNITRSPTEISDYMRKRLNGDETGLIFYLPMNEGTGTVVYDNCGSTNATMTGTMEWAEEYPPIKNTEITNQSRMVAPLFIENSSIGGKAKIYKDNVESFEFKEYYY